MGGRMEFDLGFGGKVGRMRPRRGDDEPFRLLLIGDFSGRAARRARGAPLALTKPVEVDAEAIDRAFAAFRVTLPIGGADAEELVTFGSLEDLHPDRLLAHVGALAEPRKL